MRAGGGGHFVEVEAWPNEQLSWLRRCHKLEHGIPSHEKDHGRIERRRYFTFIRLDCLHEPAKWPGLKSFVMIESERTVNETCRATLPTVTSRLKVTKITDTFRRMAFFSTAIGSVGVACHCRM